MAYEIGPCRPDELPELGKLTNRIFRGSRPGDMAAEYPLLFNERNCDQLRVARSSGRIVGHVGICIRDAVVLGASLRVASIGAVGTDAEGRGQGIASDLMTDAANHARAAGASLMLISGGRGLYHRLGYVDVGRFVTYRAPAGRLPQGFEMRRRNPEDLDALIGLHQREPVRFIRPREDWIALLDAGMLMNQASDVRIVSLSGRVVAYLATVLSSRDGLPSVLEFGGSRSAAMAALPALATAFAAREACLVAPAGDLLFDAEARRWGFEGEPRSFSGTIGILDPARFLDALKPYLAERLGSDLGGLAIKAGGSGVSLALGGERLELGTMGLLTAFVFGGTTEEARAVPDAPPLIAAALAPAFPMPLLWYGFNYV